MNFKARIQNKTFILSIIAFMVLLVKTFTKFQLPENFDIIVNMTLAILVGLGVLIDPVTPGILDVVPTVPKEINPVNITNEIK